MNVHWKHKNNSTIITLKLSREGIGRALGQSDTSRGDQNLEKKTTEDDCAVAVETYGVSTRGPRPTTAKINDCLASPNYWIKTPYQMSLQFIDL